MRKCKDEACNPVAQVRGQMGSGDYFGVISDGINSSLPPGALAADHHEFVVINDANRDDIRIACSKCTLQTGWVQKDLPNMPGVGEDFCVKQWAQMVDDKVRKAEMISALENVFGADLVKRHFRKSL